MNDNIGRIYIKLAHIHGISELIHIVDAGGELSSIPDNMLLNVADCIQTITQECQELVEALEVELSTNIMK